MARYKVIYLLLLTYILCVASAEEEEDKKVAKLVLEKSLPYKKEESTFMSRIASWLFPFGSSAQDSVPAEGHHGGSQYLPPPYQSHAETGCNPCNQQPWIPVASNLGDNTLINFVPPSSHHFENFNTPPRPQYGPPPKFKSPPLPFYGPPPLFKPPPQNPVFKQRPEKINKPPRQNYQNIEYLRPPLPIRPSVTHLKPISSNYGAPIGMLPPPVKGGAYHSIPGTSPSVDYGGPHQHLPPPPPPSSDSYHSIPGTSPSVGYGVPHQHLPPPPPPPSDSYGAPVTGINSGYTIKQEFLPPVEQLPSSTDDEDNYHLIQPIAFPNLNSYPVLPIHNAQTFSRDNLGQSGINHEVKINHHSSDDVQVVPSINIADYVSSIEHPINVIQSPLVDLNVKSEHPPAVDNNSHLHETSDVDSVKPGGFYGGDGRLSQNPIFVEDTHAAASALNVSVQNNHNHPQEFRSESNLLSSSFIKNILQSEVFNNKSQFTPPPMEYGSWLPTSMVSPTTWLYPIDTSTTTKKPKQIQIIIPYITNNKPLPFDKNSDRRVPQYYSTLGPVFLPPSSTESLWMKFKEDFKLAESNKVTATAFTPKPTTTQVYNIRDLLKDTKGFHSNLPYDVISLQNNIDDWTQQEYSKSLDFNPKKSSTSSKFVPSKQIPDEYFPTQPYAETTTAMNNFDYEPASSDKEEKKVSSSNDIESNFIFTDDVETTTAGEEESSTAITTTEKTEKIKKSLWDFNSVAISPLTKEKVYIVTPQPQIGVKKESSSVATPKFLVRVDPENKESRAKLNDSANPLTVVLSEWPHLINNLQTTTTIKPPTSRHPLFGLMDLSAYTPPPNSTVQTYSGHSKVVTVVTPPSVTNKRL